MLTIELRAETLYSNKTEKVTFHLLIILATEQTYWLLGERFYPNVGKYVYFR